MDVRDGLPGSLSDIDTHVVAIRREPFVDQGSSLSQDGEQLAQLLWGQVPEIDGVPTGHDKTVPWIKGIGIQERRSQLAIDQQLGPLE